MVNRIGPDHLASEDAAKVPRRHMEGPIHRRFHCGVGLKFKARNASISDAARDNPIEVAQVRRHIQGKAMRGNRLRDVHPDRSNFLLSYSRLRKGLFSVAREGPDSCAFWNSLSHHPKLRAGPDQHLFQKPDEIDRSEMRSPFAREIASQIHDWITHELARAVVCHIATTINFVEFYSALRQQLLTGQQIRPRGIATKRDDGRVLQQQERVANRVLLPRRDYSLLRFHRLSVGNTAEMEEIHEHESSFRLVLTDRTVLAQLDVDRHPLHTAEAVQ